MRVAVVGTGIMGAAMARALTKSGHDVVAWNRTRRKAEPLAEAGVEVASTVTEAVTGADVVITILFDTDAVLAVAAEIVAALGTESVWVQASTVGTEGVRRIAEVAGSAATRFLDAPVLGTRKPAEDGTLVVLVSGAAGARETAQPVFDAIGSRTLIVGEEIGQGSALKLACNSWIGLITVGTAQAVALAQAQGLDPALFLEAIQGGAVDSPYAHLKAPAMISCDWGPVSFELDGVRKDVRLMIEAAEATDVPTDLLRAVLGLYDRASEKGHGADDMGAVRTAFGD